MIIIKLQTFIGSIMDVIEFKLFVFLV